MKGWNFQVKSSPKEISKKLESALGDARRFAFNMNHDKINDITFKIRKRALLAFEINTQNSIIVNGSISKKGIRNKTEVEISFSQHPLAKLLMYGHIILGLGLLAGIILELNGNSYSYIIAGILLAIGVLLWVHFQKNFDKNVQEYKKLISEILEI